MPVEAGSFRGTVGKLVSPHVIHVGVGNKPPRLPAAHIDRQVNGR